jgi:hypothetical protein
MIKQILTEKGYIDGLTGLYLPFPYKEPKPNKNVFERKYGNYNLRYVSLNERGVPYGKRVRSVMSLITTIAVKNKLPFIDLGRVTKAADKMGIPDIGGAQISKLREIVYKLGDLSISSTSKVVQKEYNILRQRNIHLADEVQLVWAIKGKLKKEGGKQIESDFFREENYIKLSDDFFRIVTYRPVIIDIVKYNALSMVEQDIYAWLTYITYSLYKKGKKKRFIKWDSGIYEQFSDHVDPRKKPDFRKNMAKRIDKIRTDIYPELKIAIDQSPTGGITIFPSPLHIKEKDSKAGSVIPISIPYAE